MVSDSNFEFPTGGRFWGCFWCFQAIFAPFFPPASPSKPLLHHLLPPGAAREPFLVRIDDYPKFPIEEHLIALSAGGVRAENAASLLLQVYQPGKFRLLRCQTRCEGEIIEIWVQSLGHATKSTLTSRLPCF